MNAEFSRAAADGQPPADAGLTPLDGEAGIPSVSERANGKVPGKAIGMAVLAVASLGIAVYATVARFTGTDATETEAKAERFAPQAAVTQVSGRSFDATRPPPGSVDDVPVESEIPAIEPDAEPITVEPLRSASPERDPKDAPALLTLPNLQDTRSIDTAVARSGVARSGSQFVRTAATDDPLARSSDSLARTQASMDQYQASLQGMMGQLQDQLKKVSGNASTGGGGLANLAAAFGGGQLPGGAVAGGQGSTGTARVRASRLQDQSLLMPRGTSFTCALKTRIVSEQAGSVSCQVLRNVYSADGRVVLVERGSHLDGEYSAEIRTGQTRIMAIWSRLRTPDGIVVDLDSPATGPLGEGGVAGYVDNHWPERIGAALLLSLIEDGLNIAAAAASRNDSGTSILLQGQQNTTADLADKVLENTINIPPTIYKNQGELVGIYVSKDVDFSSVYELRAAAR